MSKKNEHPGSRVQKGKPRELPESEAHDRLRGLLAELYCAINQTLTPTDQFIEGFFRLRPHLAGKGRTFLAATVFSLLRRRPRVLLLNHWALRGSAPSSPASMKEYIVQVPPIEETAMAMYLWLLEDVQVERRKASAMTELALEQAVLGTLAAEKDLHGTLDAMKSFAGRVEADPELKDAPALIRHAARYSAAPELLERWIARFGEGEALKLAASFQEPAPLDIRVNPHVRSRDEVMEAFRGKEIAAEAGAYSVDCIRLLKKSPLKEAPGYHDGAFEIHEQASQLASRALAPEQTWKVLDACAGAGGKTIHLASIMGGKGVVYANDTAAERMQPLERRIPQNRLTNVRVLWPGTTTLHGPYDGVLIDAPCLGLGRLRREPTLHWRRELPERIAETTALQLECIRLYAPLVKQGGVLVYATCSFEPEETTGMVRELMALMPDLRPEALPFDHPDPVSSMNEDRSQVTLLPSRHNTDGFFIARFRRG
jgi:16S rRNA (cytosine967-C5)-methyltransferase